MGRKDTKKAVAAAAAAVAAAVVVVEEPSASEEEQEVEKPKKESSKNDEGSAESTGDEEAEGGESKKKGEKVDDDDGKKKKKKKRYTEALHPPTTEMILDALISLDDRKGVTIKAIKDFMTTQNTVRPESLSHLMRAALKKLVEKEKIIRPKGEENKSVMMGRYKIAPKKEEKGQKPRERPSSLRKLVDPDAPKKKKKKRRRY